MTAKAAANAPDDAPQIVSLRSVPDRKETRILAFEIDDKQYSIPTAVPNNKALRYLHINRTQGQEAGIDFMLETLLGTEGHEALMNFEDLTADNLVDVIRKCQEVMTGAIETPKGKSRKG